MEEESTAGKMGGGMKESISMIRNMDLGLILGQMGGNMSVSGSIVRDTEWAK